MVYAALKKLSPFKTAVAICQYAVINSTSSEPRNLHFKGFLNGVFILSSDDKSRIFTTFLRCCDEKLLFKIESFKGKFVVAIRLPDYIRFSKTDFSINLSQ